MNILQDPRDFFYDDSIDEEIEHIDTEIPYVMLILLRVLAILLKSNDLVDLDLLETELE